MSGTQLFVANVLRLGLGLLGNVLTAAALGAAGLGQFSLIMAVVGICGTLADAGLSYGLVRALARERDAQPLYARTLARTFATLRLLSGVAAALIGASLALPLALLVLGDADQAPLLAFAFLTLAAQGVGSYPGAVLQALDRFGRLSLATLLNAAITTGGIVMLWLSGNLTLEWLLAWNVALPIVSTLPAWLLLAPEWRPWRIAGRAWDGRWREAAGEIWGFGRWVIVAVLGSVVLGQLDLILVGRLSGAAAAGIYAVGLTLASRLDTVNQTLLTVLLPRASRLRSGAQLAGYARQVGAATGLVALTFIPLWLLAPALIDWLYGAEFSAAAPIFQVLLLVAAIDLLTSALLLLAFPLNRPRILAAAEWLRVALLLGAGWLLIPVMGPIGAAWAKLLAKAGGAAYALPALARAARRQTADEA